MERIQEALAKARQQRGGAAEPAAAPAIPVSPATMPAEPAPLSAPALGPVAAAWAALPEIAPDRAQLTRSHLVAATGGREAVAFDVMRTRLLQAVRANGWKRIAITSPGPSCGKTTVCLNLGLGLGRQPDLRVMLVECDLRRPAMARMLGYRPTARMDAVFSGQTGLAEAGVRVGDNLGILAGSAAVAGSAEILQAPETGAALDRLEATYEPTVTLFDMPPLLVGDDVMAFIAKVDAVLIVAGAGSTTVKEIDRCEREIAGQSNVLGVVVNKCRYLPPVESYGYYYE